MAMSASHLSAAIKAAMLSRAWVANVPELTEFCDDLAGAIVAEVRAALITVPTGTAGLGTTTTPGNPVGPSAAPVPIIGAIS